MGTTTRSGPGVVRDVSRPDAVSYFQFLVSAVRG